MGAGESHNRQPLGQSIFPGSVFDKKWKIIIYISDGHKGIPPLSLYLIRTYLFICFSLEDEQINSRTCSTSGANVALIENKITIL